MATENPSARIARLLTLVPWLSSRPGITLEETAEHFGIDVATLERDLWQVILCGVPGYGPDQLVDIDFWDDGAIFVHDPQTLIAPLRLSPEESTALLLGLYALAQTPGVEHGRAIASAAAKIESALSETTLSSRVLPAAQVPGDIYETIHGAIGEHGAVVVEYVSAEAAVSERTVWPRQSISIDGISYISGWCDRAEAVRTFRVDRILSARPVSGITPPVDVESVAWWEDLAAHRALVSVPIGQRWILEEAAAVEIHEEADGRITASIGFANAAWVCAWVVRHGGALVVSDPPWVRELVCEQAKRLLQSIALRAG